MITIHSSELEKVTPKMAREWLRQNIFERQRNMRPHHRDNLVKEIQAERFIQGTQIHFVRCDGERFLVNGQHTLSAIEKSVIPVTLSILISDADTMEEVAELYSRHDNHLSRSILDAIRARDLHSQIGMSLDHARRVAGAVRFISSGFRRSDTNISREDVLAEIRDWEEEGSAFFDAIKKGHMAQSLITKAPILSMALVTLRHQEVAARKFWIQVARDDGLHRGDPRKALHEFINMTRVRHGAFVRGTSVVTQAYTARAVAAAWNAFFSKKSLTRIHVYDPDREILIKGTPYKGIKTT